MEVRKAVFPVAGLGTRFLPATKAMPKELLPIIDKPLIQYAVEEAINAGIDTMIFITGRNKRAIEDHFDVNSELEQALHKSDKTEQANMIRNILPDGVQSIFIRQPEQLGLGHAISCAERVIAGETFAVLLADDFLINNPSGVTANLVNAFKKSGKSQISVKQIDGPEISEYGVVVPSDCSDRVNGLVEKPHFQEAPSNLASIGRYVLRPDIFGIIRNLSPGTGGEIQLADAINIQAGKANVEQVKLIGDHYDCGSVKGYLLACLAEGKNRGIIS